MRCLALVSLAVTVTGCLGEIATSNDLPPPNADPLAGCALSCHGTELSNAPPKSISGATDTTSVSVGAHQAHVGVAPDWHRQVECSDCHKVPQTIGDPGHMDDGDNKAELTFGMIAGPNATWTGTSCTTSCHGSAALGGTAPEPVWTQVDGTQAQCGSCHGAPPPAPHPTDTNCSSCHPTIEANLTFRDPASHINGIVDVVGGDGATGGCSSCHGGPDSSAPPKALNGDTANTTRGVGAHQAHLKLSTWRKAITCTACHQVPQTLDAPGHRDGDNVAELRFDAMNPAGTYSAATATCSNLYCHGNGRGNTGTDVWNVPGALACGACHSVNGGNMSGEHSKHVREEGMRCTECHADVVDANLGIKNANLHVNGVHEIKMANGTWNAGNRSCSNTQCHGVETW